MMATAARPTTVATPRACKRTRPTAGTPSRGAKSWSTPSSRPRAPRCRAWGRATAGTRGRGCRLCRCGRSDCGLWAFFVAFFCVKRAFYTCGEQGDRERQATLRAWGVGVCWAADEERASERGPERHDCVFFFPLSPNKAGAALASSLLTIGATPANPSSLVEPGPRADRERTAHTRSNRAHRVFFPPTFPPRHLCPPHRTRHGGHRHRRRQQRVDAQRRLSADAVPGCVSENEWGARLAVCVQRAGTACPHPGATWCGAAAMLCVGCVAGCGAEEERARRDTLPQSIARNPAPTFLPSPHPPHPPPRPKPTPSTCWPAPRRRPTPRTRSA